MKPRGLVCAMAFGAVLMLAGTVRAQETVLSGTVVDATDAVLPGVTVTALHVESGNTFVGLSDAAGEYRIGALRTGFYKVTAELPGFTTATRENFELLLGQRGAVNFKLTLSTVQESVTVTGEAPLLDTSQSRPGGNIDSRQMQELPVNGRNWMDLTMLAPGSRVNALVAGDNPTVGAASALAYQINLDGQQLTNLIGTNDQPRFSRETIAEFEVITSRFDATQGRSMGLQVNAITKSGTNRYAGTVSGYFRDSSMKAADFITHTVLPYSDQQVAGTFGGPIRQNKAHFFGHYEYEREPQSVSFTSPYPRFNIPTLTGTRTERKGGGRVDIQLSVETRLMVRGSGYFLGYPYDPGGIGSATLHPSAGARSDRSSDQVFGTLTQVMGNSVVNEIKGGYGSFGFHRAGLAGLEQSPRINLRGYSLGKAPTQPQNIFQHDIQIRDDLTVVLTGAGRHELKLGGEAIYYLTDFDPYLNPATPRDGVFDATGGPVPANIEDLFPVWNDTSTWNLAGLSPVTRFYTLGVGTFVFENRKKVGAAWVQDNWAVTPRLTLNLGLRYDVEIGALGEHLTYPPFLPERRPSDTLNFQPRLGFAYTLADSKTVIRGGVGKYFSQVADYPNFQMNAARLAATVTVSNDGRPDFAANPLTGPPPSFEAASKLTGRDARIVAPGLHAPYSWQSSIGVQRQLGQTMAVDADYVYTGGRREHNARNGNLSYNPATGANYPFGDIGKRPYPDWGQLLLLYSNGWSNYHGLQTAFTKRLSQRWQASATYTLSASRDAVGAPTGPCVVSGVLSPCPAGFKVAPDLGGEYTLAAGDQRHRAVFNGIWQLPYRFQVSGLYFFGSGQRVVTTYGADLRQIGPGAAGRLRPNGTLVPRNNFVGTPLHRVDLRVLHKIPIYRSANIDGIFEVFNLFNHVNHGSYVTVETNPLYGRPQTHANVAYQPRTLQLGFRVAF